MDKLTFLEIGKLIEEAQTGSVQAREKIVGSYMKYIYKKAFTTNITAMDTEDIISIGVMSVLECIKKYDILKNANFTSYVTTAINKNIMNIQIRNYNKTKLDTPLYKVDAILIKDDHTADNIIIAMERKTLKEALTSLKESEKTLIDNIYFKRRSLKDISEELDVNYVTVINRRNSILKKLLKFLE